MAAEGYIPFKGYRTYYKVYGNLKSGTPLVVLHGGPGYPHYTLENISELLKPIRRAQAGKFSMIDREVSGCTVNKRLTKS